MKKIIAAATTYARNRFFQKTKPWDKEKDQNELFAAMKEFGLKGIHAMAGTHAGTVETPKGDLLLIIDIGDEIQIQFSSRDDFFGPPVQYKKYPLVQIIDYREDMLREELVERLADYLLGERLPLDIVRADTGEMLIPAQKKITNTLLRSVANHRDQIEIDPSPIRNRVLEVIYQVEKKFEKEN